MDAISGPFSGQGLAKVGRDVFACKYIVPFGKLMSQKLQRNEVGL